MPTRQISRVAPIGKRFGRVTVISPTFRQGDASAVTCQCDCGDERTYFIANLRCQKEPMCPPCREQSRPAKGQSGKHPLFNIWKAMIQRCENPRHTWYSRYGGRGIKICASWRGDFETFVRDVGERPSLRHTIDRENPNGNYEPGNCRWLTIGEQQNNRGNTIRFQYHGRAMTIKEACAETGIDHATMAWRYKAGWTPEEMMSIPSMNTANKGKPKRNPIERAARALCELAGNPPGATMDGKPLWQSYLPEVRAVLSAIREPSAGMLNAGAADSSWSDMRDEARLIFTDMIDAALEEGK